MTETVCKMNLLNKREREREDVVEVYKIGSTVIAEDNGKKLSLQKKESQKEKI